MLNNKLKQEIDELLLKKSTLEEELKTKRNKLDQSMQAENLRIAIEEQAKYEAFLEGLIGAKIPKIEIKDIGYPNSGYDSSHGTWIIKTDNDTIIMHTYPIFSRKTEDHKGYPTPNKSVYGEDTAKQ